MRAAALALAFIAGPAFGGAPSPFVEGLLWRISKSGLPDSYAFGTIHVADPRVAISKPVADALARSRTLALELIDAVADQRVFDLEQLPDGSQLKALVGDAAFAQVSTELVAQDIPQDVIARMKPWAAMMKVARLPRGSESTIDHQLLQAGRARGMKVELLELVDEQIAAFDAVPLDTQVALLKHVLAERPALEAGVERAIHAWLRGDLAQLARLNAGSNDRFPEMTRHYQVLVRHIIHDRNVLMHHRLFIPLRGGRVFIAVGAMHLHGDKGLLALIAQDGYRVTRLRQ